VLLGPIIYVKVQSAPRGRSVFIQYNTAEILRRKMVK